MENNNEVTIEAVDLFEQPTTQAQAEAAPAQTQEAEAQAQAAAEAEAEAEAEASAQAEAAPQPQGKVLSEEEFEALQKKAAIAELYQDPEKLAILTRDYDKMTVNEFLASQFEAEKPFLKDDPDRDALFNDWLESKYAGIDLTLENFGLTQLEYKGLMHEFSSVKEKGKQEKQALLESAQTQLKASEQQLDADAKARFDNAAKEFEEKLSAYKPEIEYVDASKVKQRMDAILDSPDAFYEPYIKRDSKGTITGFDHEKFTKVATALEVLENLPTILAAEKEKWAKQATEAAAQVLQNQQPNGLKPPLGQSNVVKIEEVRF